MHDPKFEKEVQERMDGLEFNPSDQVWIRLEQELNKGKRRPLPLFWLFILIGGILIGAGGTWFFFGRNGHPVTVQQVASQSAVPQLGSQPAGSHPAGSEPTALQPISAPSAARPSTISPSSRLQSPHFPSAARTSRGSSSAVVTSVSTPFSIPSSAFQTASSRPSYRAAPGISQPTSSQAVPPVAPELLAGDSDAEPDGSLSASPVRTGLVPIRSYLAPWTIPAPAVAASHTAAKKPIMYKRPVWQAGFTGGMGISDLEQGILRQSAMSPAGVSLTTPAGVAYGGIPRAYSFIDPKVSPGVSFWAGVFVQKPMGRRLSISAGLNLHYYSTRITTGQQVTSNSNYPTPSLFYTSAVAPSSQAYPYYPPGDNNNYLNRYYFLEVPISMQWQFNHSDRLPLFLEGGVSASRLMSVNALYYNESSGVYYKFGTPSANPLQLFSSASLLAGLRWGSTRIQVGPQVQYGLTSLLRSNTGPAQHLLYGGLKLIVIPGWK